MKQILFYFLIFLFSINTSSIGQNKKQIYTVKYVIDGDTFVIDDGTTKGEKVRLIGIDAP